MKKFLMVLLSVLTVFVFVACGGVDEGNILNIGFRNMDTGKNLTRKMYVVGVDGKGWPDDVMDFAKKEIKNFKKEESNPIYVDDVVFLVPLSVLNKDSEVLPKIEEYFIKEGYELNHCEGVYDLIRRKKLTSNYFKPDTEKDEKLLKEVLELGAADDYFQERYYIIGFKNLIER